MGFDKQLLTLNNRLLRESVLESLGEIFSDIVIVTNRQDLYRDCPVRTFSDEFIDKGPLAGIHVALKHAESEYIYLLACDMPIVNPDYIRFMKRRLDETHADICVARRNGKVEPFNAFYSRSLYSEAEQRLVDNNTSLFRFIKSSNTLIIPEEEFAVYENGPGMFTNLNTMEEYSDFMAENDPYGGLEAVLKDNLRKENLKNVFTG